MSTFLNAKELAELTGVRIGKDGKTREQLQAAELKRMKIPHFVNARGCPVVARAIIEGGTQQPTPQHKGWEPAFA
ncbi:hypothetical protein AcdelDRAFT_1968 [Acidovorax delafieldii 2AN]|uniref:DUF4224 domain-containing protein n=1 Tax=Acidovorax delafieldii 2AN TaxID=573060 RepID=C5T4Y8_ACIDE|nr:DUF4224 domain-containing protein [Acidovorax delafieldii]EER60443.1 hypothetical protein AcdelDRAFT_1968 [Acidovorax delafieldii 2AN]